MLVRFASRSWRTRSHRRLALHCTQWHSYTTKISDPLGILFFGSDAFSSASLKALHHESLLNPSLVKSLDVVVRHSKPAGRGLRGVRDPPLKGLATQLGLPIHEREAFEDWVPPSHINLIVAVSFGMFLPKQLLRKAKYGGLNLHPSLLPDLRGAAPLHQAILCGRTHTGVTLQTLDEEAFDRGLVLAQTPRPGIPIPPDCTTAQLEALVSPVAAEMLLDGLRAGVHVPALESVGWVPTDEERMSLKNAWKVTKQRRQIQWHKWSAPDFGRHQRALGSLWSSALDQSGAVKRLIVEDADILPSVPDHVVAYLQHYNESSDAADWENFEDNAAGGVVWLFREQTKNGKGGSVETMRQLTLPYFVAEDERSVLLPAVKGGGCVRIHTIKMEGETTQPAAKVLERFNVSSSRPDTMFGIVDVAEVAVDAARIPIRFVLDAIHFDT